MTSDATTDQTPGDELTVGELRRQLQDRHGTALADTDKTLQAVTVSTARRQVSDRMVRAAERLQTAAGLIGRDPCAVRGILDPEDPVKAAHTSLVDLIQLFGVAEVLAGRGARRVRGE
ncbi:hypothetical protein [Corynebacterium glyciniphilum]|uniref:hypothetical protein n=1 Tax=Corynebacterium glyciniphilum TaxID=1404244 RepID=UPI0011AB588C|nr:hypothetical protein [Corynebacterium glyciniphilum]